MMYKLNRGSSPTKRQRQVSVSEASAEAGEDEYDPQADEQMAALQRILRQELRKQTDLLSEQFQRTTDSLKEELVGMKQRIGELEQHVSQQGHTIHHLCEEIDKRDTRILKLEGEIEELMREGNCPILTFRGPRVLSAPTEEPWREDVAGTMKTMLQKYMSDTEVKKEDIVQCTGVEKGKAIMCRFSQWGHIRLLTKAHVRSRSGQSTKIACFHSGCR